MAERAAIQECDQELLWERDPGIRRRIIDRRDNLAHATDDPAVWVWATLKDDDVEFAKRSRLRSIIRELVEEKTGPSMLVKFRFRSASEIEHQA